METHKLVSRLVSTVFPNHKVKIYAKVSKQQNKDDIMDSKLELSKSTVKELAKFENVV